MNWKLRNLEADKNSQWFFFLLLCEMITYWILWQYVHKNYYVKLLLTEYCGNMCIDMCPLALCRKGECSLALIWQTKPDRHCGQASSLRTKHGLQLGSSASHSQPHTFWSHTACEAGILTPHQWSRTPAEKKLHCTYIWLKREILKYLKY